MALYITVSEGPTAGLSEPIVATSDAEVVRLIGRALAERLGHNLPHREVAAGGSRREPQAHEGLGR